MVPACLPYKVYGYGKGLQKTYFNERAEAILNTLRTWSDTHSFDLRKPGGAASEFLKQMGGDRGTPFAGMQVVFDALSIPDAARLCSLEGEKRPPAHLCTLGTGCKLKSWKMTDLNKPRLQQERDASEAIRSTQQGLQRWDLPQHPLY